MQTITRTIILKPEEIEILKAHRGKLDYTRPALSRLISVKKGDINYICATDSHALVAIRLLDCELAPGSWQILKITKENKRLSSVMLEFIDDQPPDVSYYIDQFGFSGQRFEITINKKNSTGTSSAQIGIYKNTNKAIQYDFIKRLHYPTAWIYRASCTAHDKVLALTNEDPNIQAYILPFKM